jgi:hypothetical protein
MVADSPYFDEDPDPHYSEKPDPQPNAMVSDPDSWSPDPGAFLDTRSPTNPILILT